MVDIVLVVVSHSLHHMPVVDPLVEHLKVQHSDQSTQSRLALVTAELEDTEASPLVALAVVACRPFLLASRPELDSAKAATWGSALRKLVDIEVGQEDRWLVVEVGRLIVEEGKRLAFQVTVHKAYQVVIHKVLQQQEGTYLDSYLA